jgi:hypothetical protein
MKFRLKQGDVSAIQWTGENADEIRELVARSVDAASNVCDVGGGFLAVGDGVLRPRDWLVTGVDQQMISLRSDIFEKMFEPVAEETSHHLDPGGDVHLPAVFIHCSNCGHSCNRCGACSLCSPTGSHNGTLLGRLLGRVLRP